MTESFLIRLNREGQAVGWVVVVVVVVVGVLTDDDDFDYIDRGVAGPVSLSIIS
jgi:hypothetical protein